jgi:signal transduction histidine kinase
MPRLADSLQKILPAGGRALLDRPSLGAWLAGINVLVVLLVIGGISVSAIGLLRDLADDQGLGRVRLAGASAREELRRVSEDTLTAARTLAARPTLQRLIRERRLASLGPFLKRACTTTGADTCAVIVPGAAPVAVGRPVAWDTVLPAIAEQGERFLAISTATDAPVTGARASIAGGPTEVVLLRALDPALAGLLGERAGLEVRLLNYLEFAAAPADEFTGLHTAALADGRLAAERIPALDLYAASLPVSAATGEVVALIEVRLPAATIDSSVRSLIGQLLATAVVLGLLAVGAGALLGRRIADPMRNLSAAASRLGQGDFSTAIPLNGHAEVGMLARTMEDMRSNLVALTDTLRQREAEAQAVLQGIIEGVFAVDRDRRIRYLNPRAEQLLGVRSGEAVGRFCGDILQPEAPGGVRPCDSNCPILKARTSGSARATERLHVGEGNIRTCVVTSAGMINDIQVQVVRDETELESARRARDSVLANISHEFRTPLAAQLASIELLREGLDSLGPAERRDLVLSLERGAIRLTRLIDNLLESVRIESGETSLRQQRVNLGDVVDEARGQVEALLLQRHQRLTIDMPADLPAIDGDAPRLTQVFVNLVANAGKFAPEGSEIRVGGATAGSAVLVWVEDEGPGVPEPAEGSIFDRFHRGASEEPEPGGLGLGLWIVKSIVDRHGGSVVAARTPENRTRFTVTLPRARGA